MAVTITSYTNSDGVIYRMEAEIHLVSSITTNIVGFPGSFSTSPDKYFKHYYIDVNTPAFTSSLLYSPNRIALNNSTTNPLKILAVYEPLRYGRHTAHLWFTESNTGEIERIRFIGTYTSEHGITLDIVDSQPFGTLGLIDGVGTSAVENVDGVTTKIVF